MATIKSYTDLEQSKKLEEILPIESADMIWKKELKYRICSDEYKVSESDFIYCPTFKEEKIIMLNFDVPCWSLTALLNAIPSSTLDSSDSHHYRIRCNERYSEWYDNPIDACYNMILRLHKLNIL